MNKDSSTRQENGTTEVGSCQDSSDCQDTFGLVLLYGEMVMVIVFVVEVFTKIFGIGSSMYMKNQEFMLDSIILAFTVIAFTFNYVDNQLLSTVNEYVTIPENTYRGLKMLRVAQLFRMLVRVL